MLWIFLIAGMIACPLYFDILWQKRWFKILWWIVIFAAFGALLRAHRVLN
jgi:hypothetical protein